MLFGKTLLKTVVVSPGQYPLESREERMQATYKNFSPLSLVVKRTAKGLAFKIPLSSSKVFFSIF